MQGQQKSLADKFDVVMYGIIYKISNEGSGPDVKGYISILFMQLYIAFFELLISVWDYISVGAFYSED